MTKINLDDMSHIEMIGLIDSIVKRIKRETFSYGWEAGYEQGKFDAEYGEGMDAVRFEDLRGKLTERIGELKSKETPQQARDRIVEQAKADLSELKTSKPTGVSGWAYPYGGLRCDAEFIVNPSKRTVVCLIKYRFDKRIVSKGIAKCAPDDCFNSHIGRAIALRRALGLEVPDEYLNAPQPTEVRVGDLNEVRMPSGKTKRLRIVDKDISEIGEDECSLYSAAVARGRVVEEGE